MTEDQKARRGAWIVTLLLLTLMALAGLVDNNAPQATPGVACACTWR
jgi:hypothetical protein